MTFVPAGLMEPTRTTIPRRPRSVRRTSDLTIAFVNAGAGNGQQALELTGGARDLRTDARGRAQLLEEATVRAVVGAGRELERLTTSPDDPGAQSLLGQRVAGGFRAAVDQAVPEHRERRSPLYLLLDDLPVAALISGYASLYRREPVVGSETPHRGTERSASGLKADICSGWRSDGTMMVAVRRDGQVPVTMGPTAPLLEDPADPAGWHHVAALPPWAMRRRRLVDVSGPSGASMLVVHAMFRDTHADEEAVETVLHEYTLDLEVDARSLVVARSEATPRVLPWEECPAAAASARRLEGHHVDDLRGFVKAELWGTSTCTHLNDLLRSVGDVGTLARSLV